MIKAIEVGNKKEKISLVNILLKHLEVIGDIFV